MRYFLIIFGAVFFMSSCSEEQIKEPASKAAPTLVQVSVIDALLQGFYDGFMPLGELKSYGGFGIGTFNALDGEMIVLNDTVFQVRAGGNVYLPADTETTPFAAVTPYLSDTSYVLNEVDFASLDENFNTYFPTPNIFYLVLLKGEFSYVHTRSVPAQVKPYPPLADVTANQPEFEFENMHGDIVGFYCPAYAKGINVTGFHLHFLDKNRQKGGHIIDFTLESGTMELGYLLDYRLILPSGGDFYGGDFTIDRSDELEEVEGGTN